MTLRKVNSLKGCTVPKRRRPTRLALAAPVVALGMLLTACASTASSVNNAATSSAKATTNSAKGANVAAAKAVLSKYASPPNYPSLGTPFDGAKDKGKLVYLIMYSDNPFNVSEAQVTAAPLEQAGAKVVTVPANGTPQQWASGIEAAIAKGANAIDLQGFDPGSVAPQIRQAQAAGIVVTTSQFIVKGQSLPAPLKDGGVESTFTQAAQADFAAAVAFHGGPVNMLVVNSKDVPQASFMIAAMKKEQQQFCPACTVSYINVPVVDWATKEAGAVSSALLRDRSYNYILPLFDSEIPFVQSGITQSGLPASSIHIVSANGTTSILKEIHQGSQIQADVGTGLVFSGYAIAANILRILAGGKSSILSFNPRLFDASNVAQAGNPPSYLKGFGNSSKLKTEFTKLISGG